MMEEDPRKDSIAVFDSGVGGISVLKELLRLLPGEKFWFFGDSANAPYGTKTLEEVRRLTMERIGSMVERGAKAVVIACNTATSAAANQLRAKYSSIPVIGIEPALKPAALSRKHGRVIVLATEMTIREEKFHELAERFSEDTEIIAIPAPGIVTLVEEGKEESPEMDAYLRELFQPYREMQIDGIVLGCTHFPFASAGIGRAFNDKVALFDGAEGTARELKRRLKEKNLLREAGESGSVLIENSLGEEKINLSKRLLSL